MDAQDFRSLQEAYIDVYQEQELNEVHGRGRIDPYSGFDKHKESHSRTPEQSGLKMSPIDRATARENALRKRGNPEATKRANRIRSRFINPTERGLHRAISAGHTSYRDTKKRILDDQKESYDIYDIILSHLLDEGYADTVENAEVIMVNMSEEWRDSIIG